MTGYITYCFSDWLKPTFANGLMLIRNGERTDIPVRHPLPAHWQKGRNYYVKPDPDFEQWTYSRCHRRLRVLTKPGDTIFFRTLWRGRQYFIGYFTVAKKEGDPTNPILVADPLHSLFLPRFDVFISSGIIRYLNPRVRAMHVVKLHPNRLAMFLGRDFIKLSPDRARFLKRYLDGFTKRNN